MGLIQKAVIPAAGTGTRLRPLTDYLPKAMLPLGKKPVLQHIVEELKEAGVSEIAIIVRSQEKEAFTYFRKFPEVAFVIDDSVSGPGGALLRAEEFVGGEDFLVIFADAPVMGPNREEHIRELVAVKKQGAAETVLSAYRVPGSEVICRGMVRFEENQRPVDKPTRIVDLIEKPSGEGRGEQWVSACRYVLGPAIFYALKNTGRDEKGELQLTTAIRYQLLKGKRIMGVPLPGNLKRYDTGNFEGYFEAFREAVAGR